MPQAYTNIIFSKIIDNLSIIINNEFNIPVHYDEHKGNQSFLLTPESDSLISHLTSGIHRDYEVNISYQLKTGGQYTKNNFKQVSNTMERLKRLVFSNISYSNGDDWFDAGISNISYERDEEDLSLLIGLAIFNCSNIEII
tara:strand:- start:2126 stop:2548 length:423 start_codon:yes stop_codon:yes gene_type:complete